MTKFGPRQWLNLGTQEGRWNLWNPEEADCQSYQIEYFISNPFRCLAQAGFAAFGKGMRLIGGSPYNEAEHLSRLKAAKLTC